MTQVPAGSDTSRCSDGRQPHLRRRAFSLMEMLVVIALVGMFAALTYTSLSKTLPISKLRSKATEVSGFFQKARLGAIKAGCDVSIEVEPFSNKDTTQVLVAYRNNPDASKTMIGKLEIGTPDRPFNPHLAGVTAGSTDAAKANSFTASKMVYKSTGMAASTGALRLSIGQGAKQNTVEVAVISLGGQPVIRKFIKSADRPSTASAVEFFEETHFGTKWAWTWY